MTTLITLTSFAEAHISELVKNTNPKGFDKAFDDFFSKNLSVTVNGHRISRDEYKQQWQQGIVLEESADVTFRDVVEVANKTNPGSFGTVGLFFDAIYNSRIRIRAGPAQTEVKSSINMTIVHDDSIPPPPTTDFDFRRVTHVDQVVLSSPVPVVITQPAGSGA